MRFDSSGCLRLHSRRPRTVRGVVAKVRSWIGPGKIHYNENGEIVMISMVLLVSRFGYDIEDPRAPFVVADFDTGTTTIFLTLNR